MEDDSRVTRFAKKDADLLHNPRYSALATMPDETVMCHLTEGNHDALAVIFDRYRRLVIRVAMQILRDAAEAEDAMQSVFIAILETAKKFDAERGSLRVWILQHAYHYALNRRRYLSLRGAYDLSEEMIARVNLGSPTRTPGYESERLIQQALAKLSTRQRETLELAFFDGLTMQEIAERTGQSYANIRHHYYRGLEKLRMLLSSGKSEAQPSPTNREEGAYAGS
jgi:RNA polymerase sigma-70 factor (ECF subfamily)